MQIAIWLCFDEFFICLIICINLYTFEVNVFKISALKLQKIIKLLIPKHAPLISKHPVCCHLKGKVFKKRQLVLYALFRVCFHLCLQWLKTSSLEFSVASFGLNKM